MVGKTTLLEREIAINQYQLEMFRKIANDLGDASLFDRTPGHGHPPAWILGHLAICAELGQRHQGGSITHPDWVARFGTGSSDVITPEPTLTVTVLSGAIIEEYRKLQSLALSQSDDFLLRDHGVAGLAGTPIETVADAIATLFTNHFGFHLSQLSACRRTAGHTPIH